MRVFNLKIYLGLALVVLMGLANKAFHSNKAFGGDVAPTSSEQPFRVPPASALVKFEGGPDLMSTYVAYITCGTNKFGFAMPEGYRLSVTDSNRVTLVSADMNSLINWQIIGPVPTNGVDSEVERFRSLLLSRHPGGKILAEFSLSAACQRGPAFEMRWSGPGGLERQELVVFVASPIGLMEFSLVSSLEKYGTARQKMNMALLTFRCSDEQGKLVMPVFSNRL